MSPGYEISGPGPARRSRRPRPRGYEQVRPLLALPPGPRPCPHGYEPRERGCLDVGPLIPSPVVPMAMRSTASPTLTIL